MNVSYIKAIKSTYEACKVSKIVRKKGMNEYLEAEIEAGIERITEIAEGRSIRKSRQAVAKRAHPSFEGGVSQKKARRKPEAKILLQEASQSGLGLVESDKEEEAAPPLIQSWHSRGPAIPEE